MLQAMSYRQQAESYRPQAYKVTASYKMQATCKKLQVVWKMVFEDLVYRCGQTATYIWGLGHGTLPTTQALQVFQTSQIVFHGRANLDVMMPFAGLFFLSG